MTAAEKVAAINVILADETSSFEEKMAAIRTVLNHSRQLRSRLDPGWNPDDDPEVYGRSRRTQGQSRNLEP
ncbi:hypothetical protein ACFV9C_43985 [Kribbella sp. NPDC059898]|uniref:hypothetical protein n=1 Tax=Kribbella sp. NPDC059898 TaxID=3346995 RepID=UPI00366A1E75